jgi:hypothetical protein
MKLERMMLVATLLILASACGGGGDGEKDDSGSALDPGTGGSGLTASFTADQPSPGANTVSLAQDGTSGDAVTVAVRITDVLGVHVAAFDVAYDSSAVQYVGWAAGNLLEQGGNTPTYQVAAQSGRVVVGISRQGSNSTSAVGSRTAIDLTFRVLQAGSHTLTLDNAFLRNGTLATISGVSWFGGTAVGN